MKFFLKEKKIHTDNYGMTIVEVLVGFVVLAVILASLSGIIVVSRNMYFRSIDTSKELGMIQEELYKTNAINGAQEITGAFTFVPGDGMPQTNGNAEITTNIKLYSIGEEQLLGSEGSELSAYKYYFLKSGN